MTSLADATVAGAAPPTAEVTAIRPDGVAVTLPQSSVPRALELGYRLEDAAGTAARLRHQEYGTVGKELGSAALGAARGLTFGLSDVALRKSGALTPEQLRAYQEESPTASTLGEYGGIAAGVLTPGAIGRVLGTGIRGAAAVGDLAAGALNAGTRAAGIVGRAGATGIALDALAGGAAGVARGAAEGAVYGAGQGISNLAARDESELGHPAELAQVMVAHAGMGALLGGAISGTIGGTTSLGLSATRRVLRRLGTPAEGASLADAAAVAAPGEATPTGEATAPIDVPPDLTQPRPVPSGEPVVEGGAPPLPSEDAPVAHVPGGDTAANSKREPATGAGNTERGTQRLGVPLQGEGPGKFEIGPLDRDEADSLHRAMWGNITPLRGNDMSIAKGLRRGSRASVLKDHTRALDSVMDKSVATQDTVLFRGVDLGDWGNDIKAGKVIRDKAFLSASTDSRVGKNFAGLVRKYVFSAYPETKGMRALFVIRMRAGQNGVPLSELLGHNNAQGYNGVVESEIMLPRRTQLKIMRVLDGPTKVGDHELPPHKIIYADMMQVPEKAADKPISQPSVAAEHVVDIPHDAPLPLPKPAAPAPVAEAPTDAPAAPSGQPRTTVDKLRDTVLKYAGAPTAAVTSLTSGVDQDFLSKLAAPGEAGVRLRKVAFEGDDIVSDQTRALTKTVTGLEDDAHVVMNATLGQPKSTTMGNAMRRDHLPVQLTGAMEQVNRAQALIDQARDVQYEGAGEGSLKRFEKAVLAARVKLLRLGETGENAADAGREAFTAIDTLKKAMGHVAKPGGALRSDELAVAKLFRTDYNGGIQKFLENTEVWGEAGNIQRTHNEFWKRLLDKKKVFDQTFMTDLGRYEDEDFWTTRRVADPARVHSFLSDAGHVRADLKSSVALDQVQSLADFARSARDNFELSAEAHAAAERIIAQAPVARATIRQAIEDAGTRNLAKQLTGTISGKAFALMARIDSTVGVGEPVRAELRAELRRAASRIGKGDEGPEHAAALLKAVGDIRTEQARQAELGAVGRTVRATIRAFSAAVDRSVAITERAERIATPVAVSEGKRYALSLPAGGNGDEDDNAKGPSAELKRRLRALHRFTGDPMKLYTAVHDSTRGLAAVAPQTAAEAAALAGAAVNYLGSIAPRQVAPGLYQAADGSWAPNTAEAAAFDASLRAIMHPLSVADDLADGTLTRPGVQALQAVYPGLHDMIAAMLAVRLQRAKDVPLQRRIQLSTLFNLPTDGATDAGFAAMLQQGYAAPPAAQPRQGGASPYTQQDRAAMRRNVATATQRLG